MSDKAARQLIREQLQVVRHAYYLLTGGKEIAGYRPTEDKSVYDSISEFWGERGATTAAGLLIILGLATILSLLWRGTKRGQKSYEERLAIPEPKPRPRESYEWTETAREKLAEETAAREAEARGILRREDLVPLENPWATREFFAAQVRHATDYLVKCEGSVEDTIRDTINSQATIKPQLTFLQRLGKVLINPGEAFVEQHRIAENIIRTIENIRNGIQKCRELGNTLGALGPDSRTDLSNAFVALANLLDIDNENALQRIQAVVDFYKREDGQTKDQHDRDQDIILICEALGGLRDALVIIRGIYVATNALNTADATALSNTIQGIETSIANIQGRRLIVGSEEFD
ncbi:MAG: hypothetical protein Q8R48_01030, partial [Candidatus Omnitrophota bacterium]|nr:hypothetical protein [Candidatus Omnitrophota bacterium]